jgi:hypothetical protein
VNSYGGGDQAVVVNCSAPAKAVTQAGRSSALPASTYTPEEARMAEQYARAAMADAAASDDRHYRSFQ